MQRCTLYKSINLSLLTHIFLSHLGKSTFLDEFFLKHLPERNGSPKLVEVKVGENGTHSLVFNDVDAISNIYCKYKKDIGKELNSEFRQRNDNLRGTMRYYVDKGFLGRQKNVVEYEIKDSGFLDSVTMSYAPERMVICTYIYIQVIPFVYLYS